MGPALGQAGFRIGMFIVLTSGALLLVLDRETAEFALMSFMFIVGIIFTGAVAFLARWTQRKHRL